MVFLHETGLRVSEACRIPLQEAERWPTPPPWCRRGSCRRHRAVLRVVGKGDRERVVVLTPRALRAAATLRAEPRNGHLIGLSDRGLRAALQRIGEEVGVHLHPHRFRHTLASELVEAGVPIEIVADMLGHSTTEITRLYWIASERAKAEALRRRARWRRRNR
jgi:site-specific recombinase XerD